MVCLFLEVLSQHHEFVGWMVLANMGHPALERAITRSRRHRRSHLIHLKIRCQVPPSNSRVVFMLTKKFRASGMGCLFQSMSVMLFPTGFFWWIYE